MPVASRCPRSSSYPFLPSNQLRASCVYGAELVATMGRRGHGTSVVSWFEFIVSPWSTIPFLHLLLLFISLSLVVAPRLPSPPLGWQTHLRPLSSHHLVFKPGHSFLLPYDMSLLDLFFPIWLLPGRLFALHQYVLLLLAPSSFSLL